MAGQPAPDDDETRSRVRHVVEAELERVETLSVDPSWLTPDKKSSLERSLVELLNDAFETTQKQSAAQAAELMKGLKGLGIPGL